MFSATQNECLYYSIFLKFFWSAVYLGASNLIAIYYFHNEKVFFHYGFLEVRRESRFQLNQFSSYQFIIS